MKQFYILIAITSLFIASCADKDDTEKSREEVKSEYYDRFDHLSKGINFQKLESDSTSVDFVNEFEETEEFNYLYYMYLYNGGGIATGDVNGDGLVDFYATGTMNDNKFYLNKGNFKFEDKTDELNLAGKEEALTTGVNMADVNNDGHLDIYVCYSGPFKDERIDNQLFINNGDGTFQDKTDEFNLNDRSWSNQALFFDMDNDGDLDLYLVNHRMDFENTAQLRMKISEEGKQVRTTEPSTPEGSDKLFRNDGNKFTDVTKEYGVENFSFGLSAQFIDINEDGYLDIYVCNDFIEPDHLYINQDGNGFEDKIDKYTNIMAFNSMGSDVADINRDGQFDIMVLDMIPEPRPRRVNFNTNMKWDKHEMLKRYGYGSQIMRNIMYLNQKKGDFNEVAQALGVDATDWSWSPLWIDFDNNGILELFVSNGFIRDVAFKDLQYLSAEKRKNIKEHGSFMQQLETIPSRPIKNYFYKKSEDSIRYRNIANHVGLDQKTFSNGAIATDLNNDGLQDLLVSNIKQPLYIYKNNSDKKNYLDIRLEGSEKNNSHGIGSTVRVKVDDNWSTSLMKNAQGYLSSTTPKLHFGLGSNQIADSVVVEWTDGRISTLSDVKSNQILTIDDNDAYDYSPSEDKNTFAEKQKNYINHKHEENNFHDMRREMFIPRNFSRRGPVMASIDLNGDGIQDLVIGGSIGEMTSVYIGDENGYTEQKIEFDESINYEDSDIKFYDLNEDGNTDILISSGGSAYDEGSENYMDRYYINDGNMNFTQHEIQETNVSTSTIELIRLEGNTYLFGGAYVRPNYYPEAPDSYHKEWSGSSFKNTETVNLPNGMISDSEYADINNDGKSELIVIGEWMSPKIYNYDGTKFTQWKNTGLDKYNGWWNTIHLSDLNNDGNSDLIFGNFGINTRFKASQDEPIEVYSDDFDENGKWDALITTYIMGEKYPLPRRKQMLTQFPSLKKKYTTYDSYSQAKVEELFGKTALDKANYKKTTTLKTTAFIQTDDNSFTPLELPFEAQTTPIYSIITTDINDDGREDIILGGNDNFLEIETVSSIQTMPIVLTQTKEGKFKYVYPDKTGMAHSAAVMDMKILDNQLILSTNNGETVTYKIN